MAHADGGKPEKPEKNPCLFFLLRRDSRRLSVCNITNPNRDVNKHIYISDGIYREPLTEIMKKEFASIPSLPISYGDAERLLR